MDQCDLSVRKKKRAQNIVKQCTIRPAQIHGEEEMAGGVVLLADPITLELPEEEEGEESGAGGIDGCDPPIWYAFNKIEKMKNVVKLFHYNSVLIIVQNFFYSRFY